MDVHIHQAGRHVEIGNIDCLSRFRRRNILENGGNPAVRDGNIAYRRKMALGVHHVSTLQQKIVARLGQREGGGKWQRENQLEEQS